MRTQTVFGQTLCGLHVKRLLKIFNSKWIALSGMRGSANASCLCNIAQHNSTRSWRHTWLVLTRDAVDGVFVERMWNASLVLYGS